MIHTASAAYLLHRPRRSCREGRRRFTRCTEPASRSSPVTSFAQSSWYFANLDNLEVIKLISQVIADFADGRSRRLERCSTATPRLRVTWRRATTRPRVSSRCRVSPRRCSARSVRTSRWTCTSTASTSTGAADCRRHPGLHPVGGAAGCQGRSRVREPHRAVHSRDEPAPQGTHRDAVRRPWDLAEAIEIVNERIGDARRRRGRRRTWPCGAWASRQGEDLAGGHGRYVLERLY